MQSEIDCGPFNQISTTYIYVFERYSGDLNENKKNCKIPSDVAYDHDE